MGRMAMGAFGTLTVWVAELWHVGLCTPLLVPWLCVAQTQLSALLVRDAAHTNGRGGCGTMGFLRRCGNVTTTRVSGRRAGESGDGTRGVVRAPGATQRSLRAVAF